MIAVVRNLNNVVVNNFTFQVEHYSWSSIGGPETAMVKVASTHAALRYCLNMLRYPVEIYDYNNTLVWWGFVNKVVLQDDATRVTRSLQSYSNTIGAFYTNEEGEERFRGWIKNTITEKNDKYGEKQLLLTTSSELGSNNDITEIQLREILEHFENIAPTMETGRGNTIGATLECVGWGHTLQWEHVPHQQLGRYGDPENYPTTGTFRYAAITYLPQTQFQEGRLAQYANYRTNSNNDQSSNTHYISRVIFPMVHLEPVTGFGAVTAYGGVRVELLTANAINPIAGNNSDLSSPGSTFDNGPFINQNRMTQLVPVNPTSDGSLTEVEFRWPTSSVALPAGGWYFTLRSASNRLAVPFGRYSVWWVPSQDAGSPYHNRYLWRQVRGSGNFGSWTAWRDGSWPDWEIPSWIQIGFRFFTRMGAAELINHIVENHSIIRSPLYPNTPDADEKFSAFLNGRELSSSTIKNICSVDELFYLITPNKTLRLWNVPDDPEESSITIKKDGTLSIEPNGNLSKIVGQWVYDSSAQSIRGLCTSARYEVRTGAYDLGFRGAPSLTDVSTRVLI